MGSSPAKLDGPRICFNSAKSWQLAWYSDKHLNLIAEDISDDSYNLASVVDYDIVAKNDYLLIKVTDSADKYDYFVNFNRQKGITIDSTEGDNMIIITKVPASTYEDSQLIARLGIGEEFVTKALIDGNYLAMNYKSLQVEESPIAATVRFNRYFKCRSDFDCDHDHCSTYQCINYDRYGEGICSYTELACETCGTNINVTMITNELATELSWSVEYEDKNRIIMTSGNDLHPLTSYSQSKCIAYGRYKFLINYHQNSTLLSNISYSLKAGDKSAFYGSTNDHVESEYDFTVCQHNNDCSDFDGCTNDVCNQETRLCENTLRPESECNDCNWVSVEMITDNYPDETSWDLVAAINNREISVFSGK